MSSSNMVQLTSCEEVTLGTTPNTPRMRGRRFSGENLRYAPTYTESNDIRADGMSGDDIKTGTESGGPINFQFHYPADGSPLSADHKSACRNVWVNTPTFDNDGTADSVCTQVADSSDTFTVASGGASVVSGHLIKTTGFTNAANNGVFKVSSSTSTTIVVAGTPTLTDEAAPPAAAKIKVVGFQGTSGDIMATSTGLGSTSLDFTTLGLAVGQWIKPGGSATSDKFATAVLNVPIRITSIAAHALTCDHLPSGWTTDSGTGKTIKVWFGDQLKNGTTTLGQSIERGFMGQGTPTYILQKGMVANQFSMSFQSKQPITGVVTYMGMSGSQGTSTVDASPDSALAEASYPVMACSANVGRITEGGSTLGSPNWIRELSFEINWNSTPVEVVDSLGPQDIIQHQCTITGMTKTVFGDNALLTKFFDGTATSLSAKVEKGSRMVIWTLPRIIYNGGGSPNAGSKNQVVEVDFNFRASKDETVTNAMITIDRFDYVE